MGGSVFTAQRFGRNTYVKMYDIIIEVLNELNVYGKDIPFNYSKEDFGDIDIVVRSEDIYSEDFFEDFKQKLQEKTGVDEVFYSHDKDAAHIYGVDGIQIDVNPVPDSKFEFYREFFAWNGINMIYNSMLQHLGLKLSIKHGFKICLNKFFNYEYDRHEYFYIPLQNDFVKKALEILELDYETYALGFNNFEDIFKYIEKSPYFTPAVFDLTGKRSKDKKRMGIKKITIGGKEYFKDYDRSQYPKKEVDYSEVMEKIRNVFGNEWVDIIKDEAFATYVRTHSEKEYRAAKEFMIKNIHEKYCPDMTRAKFNQTYIQPIYKNKSLTSDSTLGELSYAIHAQIFEKE